MSNAKVVFLHGLHQRIVDAIISFNPPGFTTTVVSGKDPEEIQIDAISDAYVKADKVELATPVELDTDAAVAAATAYLDDAEPAIEGRGGNDLTYRTAARLKDYGVSEGMAGMLMLGSWNERCVPPWEAETSSTLTISEGIASTFASLLSTRECVCR